MSSLVMFSCQPYSSNVCGLRFRMCRPWLISFMSQLKPWPLVWKNSAFWVKPNPSRAIISVALLSPLKHDERSQLVTNHQINAQAILFLRIRRPGSFGSDLQAEQRQLAAQRDACRQIADYLGLTVI